MIEELSKEFRNSYQLRSGVKGKAWLQGILINNLIDKGRKNLKKPTARDVDGLNTARTCLCIRDEGDGALKVSVDIYEQYGVTKIP